VTVNFDAYDLDLDRVNMSQHSKYLCHWSFS